MVLKGMVLAQFCDWEEAEKRATIRNGESELANDDLWQMLQTCMPWLGVWYGRRWGEMMQC